ncbi:hypothetical protein FACS1894137_11870 [Spirochaetia bacterium]|nr:hypothetical protein FACS1894137_11870 [Spirochaetia bacterium]
MNGHLVKFCASPDCGIYQYRATVGGFMGVSFIPQNSQENTRIGDVQDTPPENPGNARETVWTPSKMALAGM